MFVVADFAIREKPDGNDCQNEKRYYNSKYYHNLKAFILPKVNG